MKRNVSKKSLYLKYHVPYEEIKLYLIQSLRKTYLTNQVGLPRLQFKAHGSTLKRKSEGSNLVKSNVTECFTDLGKLNFLMVVWF